MRRILLICGPTGIGKTSLALSLAREFEGELVSADSRQVYKNMDIGTGKDLPKGSKIEFLSPKLRKKGLGFYNIAGIRVWGYDIVAPQKRYNVYRYLCDAREIVKNVQKNNKLPIVVGGTGFYIRALLDGVETIKVPEDRKLRESLNKKNTETLYKGLLKKDSNKAKSMNTSDRQNKRRLIRALEIADWKLENDPKKLPKPSKLYESLLMIGLRMGKEVLNKKIAERISLQYKDEIEREIRTLLDNGINWTYQSMNSIGYIEWRDFFEKGAEKEKVIKNWYSHECQYAKRQMTWFKKDRRIKWFDVGKENWQKNIDNEVRKWYKEDTS